MASDNIQLQTCTLPEIPRASKGKLKIKLTVEYDVDLNLIITLQELISGRKSEYKFDYELYENIINKYEKIEDETQN